MRKFCQRLGTGLPACEGCRRARRHALGRFSKSTLRVPCFAGFEETFVPVRLWGVVFGWLWTTPVVTRDRTERAFDTVDAVMAAEGVAAETRAELRKIYHSSPTMERARYQGTCGIIEVFAELVCALARDLAGDRVSSDATTVSAALRFIETHFDAPLTLEDVAAHVHVSPFYLCRLFRRKTGMTMTETLGRRRVEAAGDQLVSTARPVTEIAFDVGFQSLSQFNRSFRKFTGCSPTLWREKRKRSSRSAIA